MFDGLFYVCVLLVQSPFNRNTGDVWEIDCVFLQPRMFGLLAG